MSTQWWECRSPADGSAWMRMKPARDSHRNFLPPPGPHSQDPLLLQDRAMGGNSEQGHDTWRQPTGGRRPGSPRRTWPCTRPPAELLPALRRRKASGDRVRVSREWQARGGRVPSPRVPAGHHCQPLRSSLGLKGQGRGRSPRGDPESLAGRELRGLPAGEGFVSFVTKTAQPQGRC